MAAEVSVIMPAFNAAATIIKSIDSVRTQTFRNWELIVIDDGSSDKTAEMVRDLAVLDQRVHLVSQHNGGVAAARRTGIRAARGRYVAFLDADDYWLANKLDCQIAFMAENGAPVTYTAYRRVATDGSLGRLVDVPRIVDYQKLLVENVIPNLTAIIDRQQVTEIVIPHLGHEDFAMWLNILRPGRIARGLGLDLARYRVGHHSVSANKLRAAQWVWNIYRRQERMSVLRAAVTLAGWTWRMAVKWRRF